MAPLLAEMAMPCKAGDDHESSSAALPDAIDGSREFFLTERYAFYATDRSGNLLKTNGHHQPYALQRATLLSCDEHLLGATPENPRVPELLEKLRGAWHVTGTIEGEPVDQQLEASPILAERFLELHFSGKEPPAPGFPPYEARVFLAWDDKNQRVVSFWLDVFGAGGASQGEGKQLSAHSFQVVFKYPSAWFRNTYTLDEATNSWRLLIEFRKKTGKWAVFADEKLTRGG